jgi:hypothetical protein
LECGGLRPPLRPIEFGVISEAPANSDDESIRVAKLAETDQHRHYLTSQEAAASRRTPRNGNGKGWWA